MEKQIMVYLATWRHHTSSEWDRCANDSKACSPVETKSKSISKSEMSVVKGKGLHRCGSMEENVHWLCNANTIHAFNETKHGKGCATTAKRPKKKKN